MQDGRGTVEVTLVGIVTDGCSCTGLCGNQGVRSNTERWKLLAEHAAKLVEELLLLLKTMNAESLSRRKSEVEELLRCVV
jgi:hypothetical protein